MVLGCGCCQQRIRIWLGAGDTPNFGVSAGAATCPAAPWPQKRAKEKWECSGTAELCPTDHQAPLPALPGLGAASHSQGLWDAATWLWNLWQPSWPCLSCSSHPGPLSGQGWGWRLGSPREAGKPLVSLVPTQLQPCANKTLITAGFGWGFFPPFFPSFPVGHIGICVGICDPVAAFGSPRTTWGVQDLPQPLWLWEGFSEVGQILGSKQQSAARHALLFAFSRIKTGKHLVPTPWTLPCPRAGDQLGLPGLPSLHFVQNQGCVLLIFKLRKEQSFICRCGRHFTPVKSFTFFFCGENEGCMAAPSTGIELISGFFMCGL